MLGHHCHRVSGWHPSGRRSGRQDGWPGLGVASVLAPFTFSKWATRLTEYFAVFAGISLEFFADGLRGAIKCFKFHKSVIYYCSLCG